MPCHATHHVGTVRVLWPLRLRVTASVNASEARCRSATATEGRDIGLAMERSGGGVDGTDSGAGPADNTTMTTTELCPESNNNNLIVLGTKVRSSAGFADGTGPRELGAVPVAAANRERGHQSLMEAILAQKMAKEGREHRRVKWRCASAGTTWFS